MEIKEIKNPHLEFELNSQQKRKEKKFNKQKHQNNTEIVDAIRGTEYHRITYHFIIGRFRICFETLATIEW